MAMKTKIEIQNKVAELYGDYIYPLTRLEVTDIVLKMADWLQSAESETDERIKRMSDKVDAAIKEECGHDWKDLPTASVYSKWCPICEKFKI